MLACRRLLFGVGGLDEVRERFGLFFRGVQWRAGSLIFLFLIAVIALGGAALGPLYLRAARNSVLVQGIATKPVYTTGVTVVSDKFASQPTLESVLNATPRAPDGAKVVGTPIYSVVAGGEVDNGEYLADLYYRSHMCHHVVISAGVCPSGAHAIMVSTRSAKGAGWHLGQVIKVGFLGQGFTPTHVTKYRIVGLYVAPTVLTPYWWGNNVFTYGSGPHALDAFFASPSAMPKAVSFAALQAPIVKREFRESTTPAILSALRRYESLAAFHGYDYATGLGKVVAAINATQSEMGTAVDSILVELVLVGLLVISVVTFGLVSSRKAEIRLAQLRGVKRRTMFVRVVIEPIIVLVAALPVAALGAWLLVNVLDDRWFYGKLPVAFVNSTWVMLGIAGVGGVIAVAIAAGLSMGGRSLIESRSSVSRRSRARVAIDAVVIAVAVAAVVEVITIPSSPTRIDPLVAMLPFALAVGATVAMVYVALGVLTVLIGLSHSGRPLEVFLATRQLRQRGGMLRQAIPVGLALSLVAFGAATASVLSNHRSTVVGYEVGAARVLDVSTPANLGLIPAVDEADPGGTEAMAAELYSAPSGKTLAVQASRLAAVASWPTATKIIPVQVVARRLERDGAPLPPVVTGDTLTIRARVQGSHIPADAVSVVLQVYSAAQGTPVQYSVGLTHNWITETFSLGPACASETCYFEGVGVTSIVFENVVVDVASVSSGSHLLASASNGPTLVGYQGTAVSRAPQEIRIHVIDGDAPLAAVVKSYPQKLPTVASASSAATFAGTAYGGLSNTIDGLDGNSIQVKEAGSLASLPELGNNGDLVDLTLAELSQSSVSNAAEQVWVAPHAAATIEAHLRHEGVDILSVNSAPVLVRDAARGPLGLSYNLFGLAGALAGMIAILGLIYALIQDGRGRLAEFAAMRVLNISRTSLTVSLALEALLTVGFAFVSGAIAAAIAVMLTVPRLPQLEGGLDSLLFPASIPYGVLLSASVAVAVIAFGAAGIIAWWVLRRATFEQLRVGDR